MKKMNLAEMLLFTGIFLLSTQFITCWEEKWDHFVFAQAWPMGTCADATREHHTCHIGKQVKTWTIHGLWPTLGDSRGPTSCNSSWQFDYNKIKSLETQLDEYWPNIYNDTSPSSFWAHEWIKHGTCCTDLDTTAGETNYFSAGLKLNKQYDILQEKEWDHHGTCGTLLPATSNEYKYFSKTLSLNRKYDLGTMLSESNVVPDEKKLYSYEEFVGAVKKAIGFEPVIQCANRKLKNGSDYHLIDQVQICLNKDFSPKSCYNETVDPSGYHPSKGNHSLAGFDKGEKNDLVGRRHTYHHKYEPQSSCPRKEDFHYPPIHMVYHFLK